MLDASLIDAMDHALAFRPPAVTQEVLDVRSKLVELLSSSRTRIAAANDELDAWITRGERVRAALRERLSSGQVEQRDLDALGGVIDAVERRVADDEAAYDRLSKAFARQIGDAEAISPEVEAVTREVASGTLRVLAREGLERADLGLFLRALRAEYDPAARGGPTFDDADELRRYLESAAH
jgi:hypothetical protein